MPTFNPDFLKLAREQKGLSQKDLAAALKVAQSEISKIESGKKAPNESFVERIVQFFGYTADFFEQPDVAMPSGLVFHRKRSALSATDRARIEAEARARMLDVAAFARFHDGIASELPERNGRTPAEAARALRAEWKVPAGPIENLVALLERHKVFLLAFDFGTDLLDAFFLPSAERNEPMCIAFNTNPAFPPDRHRFTLAHELGHAVLHRDEFPDAKGDRQEREANEFAGEFLAPAEDIAADLAPPLTFAKLRELKVKWKMSMSGLVRRAKEIKAIRESEYKSICFFFSKFGYRKREPSMGLLPECARAVRWLAADLFRSRGDAAPEALHLTRGLFDDRYPGAALAASQGGAPMT